MPNLAPSSMERLQSVSRASTLKACTAGPAYSTAWPAPALAPNRAIKCRITSLEVTPGPNRPSSQTRI